MLFGFTAVSLGFVYSSVTPVSASDTYLRCQDSLFDSKVLSFLKAEKVCALNEEQLDKVMRSYSVSTKEFDVNGDKINVLYVKGNPINKHKIEEVIGEKFDSNCQVVHGNMLVALISPLFVS